MDQGEQQCRGQNGKPLAIGLEPVQQGPSEQQLLRQRRQNAAQQQIEPDRLVQHGLHRVCHGGVPQAVDEPDQPHRGQIGRIDQRQGHEPALQKAAGRPGSLLLGPDGGQSPQGQVGRWKGHQIAAGRRQHPVEPGSLQKAGGQGRRQAQAQHLHRQLEHHQQRHGPAHPGKHLAVLPAQGLTQALQHVPSPPIRSAGSIVS